MGDKGFSLVELIIVIAIMAILGSALVPTFIKYIEKANIAHDTDSCKTIENCTYAVLAEDKYHDIVANGYGIGPNGSITNQLEYFIHPEDESGYYGTCNVKSVEYAHTMGEFLDELCDSLVGLEPPKQSGKKSYLVTINFESVSETSFDGSEKITYQIGDVTVKTSSMGDEEATQYFYDKGYIY